MKQLIYTGIIGFILGIISIEFTEQSVAPLYTIGFIFVAISLARLIDARLQTLFVKLLLVLLCGVLFGSLRALYAYSTLPARMFDNLVGQKNVFDAVIVSDIDTRDEYSAFIVRPQVDGFVTRYVPYVQVRAQRIQDYAYGDTVRVTGTLQTVQVKNSNTRAYKEKLVREGTYYQVSRPQIDVIEKNTAWSMKHFFITIKKYVQTVLQNNISEPAAGLASGLLIGEKHGLSKEWYDRFQSVGMTHVIVLSGYNVALVFAWTLALFFWVPFRMRHALALGSIFVLVCVSGADAPAVRSGILVGIIALATMFGRQTSIPYFLAMTTFVMVMYNPFYFLFDLSFQLSIAATYGLVFLSPIVQNYVKRIPAPFSDAARDTIAAQVAVLPLQLFSFGSVSYVSLFANTILLPLVPIIMMLGIATFFTSHISLFIAMLFGSMTAIIADIFLRGVEIFAELDPVVSIRISLAVMIGTYALLVYWVRKNIKTI